VLLFQRKICHKNTTERSSKVQLDLENSETALGYNELYKTSCRKSERKKYEP